MRILIAGVFAGICAGILATILQSIMVVPIIATAELFETGQMVYFDGDVPLVKLSALISEPRDLTTMFYTGVSTIVSAMGFALLLASVMSLRDEYLSVKQGALWGVFAFVALVLAPAIGLPPELPGSGSADVVERQVWWVGTAIATSIGLWQIAFYSSYKRLVIAVMFIALPHIVGAPHPNAYMGVTPPEMAGHFSTVALGVSLVMWVSIGTFLVMINQRQ